jgi:hypothetical protein
VFRPGFDLGPGHRIQFVLVLDHALRHGIERHERVSVVAEPVGQRRNEFGFDERQPQWHGRFLG